MLGTILSAYAVALALTAARIGSRRPVSWRRAMWIVLPAVAPAAVSAAWLVAYASQAGTGLALALLLAYALPAWILGIAVCAATDVVAWKVRSA